MDTSGHGSRKSGRSMSVAINVSFLFSTRKPYAPAQQLHSESAVPPFVWFVFRGSYSGSALDQRRLAVKPDRSQHSLRAQDCIHFLRQTGEVFNIGKAIGPPLF